MEADWLRLERRGPLDPRWDFDQPDIERARHAVLWHGMWEQQTEEVLSAVRRRGIFPTHRILDFGSGVGRLTAALGPHTIAADSSPAMRRHCPGTLAPEEVFANPRPRFDWAVAVEVFQHVPAPDLLPLLGELMTVTDRVFCWGNEWLDVDWHGRSDSTRVSEVLALAGIVSSDVVQTCRGPRWCAVLTSRQ